jgi:LacI family transcriptional regulator
MTMEEYPRIALIYSRGPFFTRGLLRGIAKYSRLHGPWLLDLVDLDLISNAEPWFTKWKGDGIIAVLEDDKLAEGILAHKVPCVIHNAHKEEKYEIPNILVDSNSIGIAAAEFLLKIGFKHFAYSGYSDIYWSQIRKASFIKQVDSLGFATSVHKEIWNANDKNWNKRNHAVLMGWKEYSRVRGQSQMLQWLKSLPKPVGLLACNDEYGRYIIEVCRRAKIKVPEDVAVLGVDNDQLVCELANPSMSSVSLNIQEAGYQAAELLDQLMQKEKIKEQNVVVKATHIQQQHSTDIFTIEDDDIRLALRFIRAKATSAIGVDDIAEHVCLTRRTLERRFRKSTGRSLQDEVKRIRIERATQLLVETELKLPQIAAATGFCNSQYLWKVFRQAKGVSPNEFRKSFRR